MLFIAEWKNRTCNLVFLIRHVPLPNCIGAKQNRVEMSQRRLYFFNKNLTKAYIVICSYFLVIISKRGRVNMGMKNSDDKDKLQQDADVLQAIDENNRQWVTAWKKAVKKSTKTNI
jgi:hypothetical protein